MKEDFAMLDENDDASLHTIIKPKTMDNNCVNLQCLNNRQKLIELKDKYDDDKNLFSKVTTEDLREYGMIPEFLGRLPIVYSLDKLNEEAYIKILKEPKNAILAQYQKLLALDEVELKFSDDALEAIAKKAIKKETGARALRSIIEEFMLDIMYEIPKDSNIGTVTITRDYIENKGAPLITMRGQDLLEAKM